MLAEMIRAFEKRWTTTPPSLNRRFVDGLLLQPYIRIFGFDRLLFDPLAVDFP
jgi:hypothetical protein